MLHGPHAAARSLRSRPGSAAGSLRSRTFARAIATPAAVHRGSDSAARPIAALWPKGAAAVG